MTAIISRGTGTSLHIRPQRTSGAVKNPPLIQDVHPDILARCMADITPYPKKWAQYVLITPPRAVLTNWETCAPMRLKVTFHLTRGGAPCGTISALITETGIPHTKFKCEFKQTGGDPVMMPSWCSFTEWPTVSAVPDENDDVVVEFHCTYRGKTMSSLTLLLGAALGSVEFEWEKIPPRGCRYPFASVMEWMDCNPSLCA